MNDIRNAYKKKDAWWTVFLVDPIASRLMLPLANYTRITPNQLTISAFAVGLMAAYCFYQGTYLMLVAGAVLYHISFTLDCMDGKISRLKGTGSIFGAWMDYILDRTRVAICAFSLMLGQYHQSGHVFYLYLAALICFLDSTRYMNSLLAYKSLNEMRKKMDKANSTLINEQKRIASPHVKRLRIMRKNKLVRKYLLAARKDISIKEDFLGEVISRFPFYLKVRAFFLKRRVRLHLMSGIEYQMFIFIIAPVAGLIKEGAIVSSIMMILFESAVIYKLWLMTLEYRRRLSRIVAEIKGIASPE
ncbi:CDP-alcohol phosphatidyltransferase family protein [Paenibacillus sp. sptzw28]|uniref:CDP-alcohol phosphatidyltransferase family protein n=1 Tax=Paenibacillus sp. sptzw28 TaxID=715179 RepID=UPI001C6EE45C|nr:CDP-alcohol phosphatidyltransferase family protein [Paenibacillus sp. sptzw28]QYR22810.1 CDP-alcohol phosphatidyltransferase family protein [Paenibacillus sp. sptzw28]